LSIAEFEHKNKAQSTNAYLLGLSAGLNTANKRLSVDKQAPLYCYPPYLNLSKANYKEIISLSIQELSPESLIRPSTDEIFLKRLSVLYPCGYN